MKVVRNMAPPTGGRANNNENPGCARVCFLIDPPTPFGVGGLNRSCDDPHRAGENKKPPPGGK